MNTFMHPQLFCSVIEVIANKAIELSKSSANALAQLSEKSLILSLSELGFAIQLQVIDDKLLVTSPKSDTNEPPATADCIITTSLSTLHEIKSEHQLTELIKQDKLDIQGDIKVAQKLAALIENIDIDWPAELEKHIGDIATHKLITLAKNISHKAKFAKKQITSDASEYLVHEQKLVVAKHELSRLLLGINESEQQVSILEQRVLALTNKLESVSN
ncbi:hypothetical protein HII17_03905 [Thalassotalea sp. M1531]|uniref:Ubiquinone biosynthesis accessory factor UbiJ n=1 Tax=Thalassotalea algicola TaxID=2716224 RepID=A0A7Y0L9Z6_9GAMM|nr:SCP2 sterol-binding domain-containing protein [Thalassotalea algicola]NMP30699.1 hypothetical protein [Thalassotalea algicola]